jgi:SpoIID/LytB domain protein
MQRYLYGLGEVPSSWPQQTLRAQSIAGRTYALRAMQTRNEGVGPCFCAVYDSVIDQAYIGDSKRTGSGPYWDDWKRAVNATNDKVVFRGGAPIQALYSSSSGGHTENNRNVWGGTQIPYLRGVRDNYDRARGANPNYRWRVTMPFRSFKSRLSGFYGLGRYRSFRLVRPFGVSGRVTIVKSSSRGGVRIAGTARTVRVSGWSIRSALSLKDSWFRVKVDPRVGANFTARNRSLGEAPGRTRSAPYPVLSSDGVVVGQAQDFVDGRLVWRSDLDSVSWLRGPMLAAYDKLGGAQSELGMPLSDAGVRSGQGTARFDGGSLREVDGVGFVPVWDAADERYGFVKRSCGEPTALPEAAGGATTWSFEGGAVTLGPAGDLTVDCS